MKSLRRPNTMFALVFSMVLAACGGGGGEAGGGGPPSVTVGPTIASGSAYQKQLLTMRRVGQTYGPAREALQGQLDNCNGVRASQYELPAVVPDEAALAGMDDAVGEHYFDTDKSALYVTVVGAVLGDYERWSAEGSGTPAVAPDCSVITRKRATAAFIWRDGRRYVLDMDNRRGWVERNDSAILALMTEAQRATLPVRTVLGEQCHVVNDPQAPFGADDACVWDRFPPVVYLDLPWALTTESVHEGIEKKMTTTEINGLAPVPSSVFEIDPGFTITNR